MTEDRSAFFQWRDHLDVRIADPRTKADIESALDRIAATDAGRRIIENGTAETVRTLGDLKSRAETWIKDHALSNTWMPPSIRGKNGKIEEAYGPAAPDEAMTGQMETLKRLRQLESDVSRGELPKIVLYSGDISSVKSGSRMIEIDPHYAKSDYIGTDGKTHRQSVARFLVHELGHTTQDLSAVAKDLDAAEAVCQPVDPTLKDSRRRPMGKPGGEFSAAVLHRKTLNSEACFAAQMAVRAKMVRTIEQPDIDMIENPAMRQIEPSSVDRGPYERTPEKGEIDFLAPPPGPSKPTRRGR